MSNNLIFNNNINFNDKIFDILYGEFKMIKCYMKCKQAY